MSPNPPHHKHAILNFIMPEPLIIGYLTSQYARVGDTFIRREVAFLRRLGHVIHTFSVRRADPGESISEDIRQEQAQTEYLWNAGIGRLARRRDHDGNHATKGVPYRGSNSGS